MVCFLTALVVPPVLVAAPSASTVETALASVVAQIADGYTMITPMIPNSGYHLLNPKIQGFDLTKPAILVYVRSGGRWQLVALEWVHPSRTAVAPLKGARYGSFAACHYVDGSFLMADAEVKCAKTNAKTGAALNFWRPPLVTQHFWIGYPNPNGVFAEFNPLLTPFNNE